MRRVLLVTVLVLAAAMVPASGTLAQSQTQLSVSYGLNPDAGTVDVRLSVEDPGSLRTLVLGLDGITDLQGAVERTGAWTQNSDENTLTADLDETPNAAAAWTAGAQTRVETLEGEGHTSYIGSDFGVIKASDLMPGISYSFPSGSPPSFTTTVRVDAPTAWDLAAPWTSVAGQPDAFRMSSPIPRGFLAADDDLDEGTIEAGERDYRMVRVEGAQEDPETRRILQSAAGYLSGLYGPTLHNQFIITAPDPMFRGGLGSPQGVFLHDEADASVVAHEMVHAYQAWPASRSSQGASLWVLEGAAVVHGALLEAAAGLTTRQEAVEFLQTQEDIARENHQTILAGLTYNSPDARALYTKSAVVITALNDAIRRTTNQEYTLSEVLTRLNNQAQSGNTGVFGEDRVLDTGEFADRIRQTTGVDATSFFQDYIYQGNVPPLGAVFPGEASVRILGTTPTDPITGEPFALRVHVSNLDTRPIDVSLPVLLDGDETARLETRLDAGGSTTETLELSPLPEGTYTLQIQASEFQLEILAPPDPIVTLNHWPPAPDEDTNVTLGMDIYNQGRSPYEGPTELRLDGGTILTQTAPVPAGANRTTSVTLAPLGAGTHTVQAVGPDGTLLADKNLTVQPSEPKPAPGPGLLVGLILLSFAASLAPRRRRSSPTTARSGSHP